MPIGIVIDVSVGAGELTSYKGKKVKLKCYYRSYGKVDARFWDAHDIDTGNRIGGFNKWRFKIVKESRPIRVRNVRCL